MQQIDNALIAIFNFLDRRLVITYYAGNLKFNLKLF